MGAFQFNKHSNGSHLYLFLYLHSTVVVNLPVTSHLRCYVQSFADKNSDLPYPRPGYSRESNPPQVIYILHFTLILIG